MTNPAFLLADLFDEWVVPKGETPEGVRERTCGQGRDFWRAHGRAAGYLLEVERLLYGMEASGGERVATFIQALDRWYEGVFAVHTPWGTGATNGIRRAVADDHIHLLRAFGILIDYWGKLRISDDDARSLEDILKRAEDLLEQDDDLSIDTRQYLWSLITEARRYLKEVHLFGETAVRRIAFELGGAMVAQSAKFEAQGQKDKAQSWRAAALQLVIGFAGGYGTQAAVLTTELLKQLPPG